MECDTSNMECDTSKWKEFRVGDLFYVELSKGDIKIDDFTEGNVRLISSVETDNGVVGHIDANGDGKAEMFSANQMTVDMFGNAFYQDEPFYAVSHGRVNVLKPRFSITKNIALFIATVIKQQQYKYSYGRAVYSKVVENMVIKLPTDPNGEPDWLFIENYIKSLRYKPLTTKNKPGQAPNLNMENWKEFEIEALFPVIIKGKCNDASCLSAGNDINYIGAKYSDNGVMKSCSLHENINYISEGNCVAMIGQGQGSAGYAIYLDSDFIGSMALNLGYADWVNPYTAHFVTTVLCKEYEKYSFGRSWTGYRLKKTKIKLPADSQGRPDWLFMENYIKSLPYGDKLDG